MQTVELNPDWVQNLRQSLCEWFQKGHRPMPWRENPDPYRVWVSEVMLQQTQVATVMPYFERFIQRFPNVQALAEAPLEEVLRYWAGLGYYSRACNMHETARRIVQNGGEFPRSADRLRELPGIGAYTAGAIASIAFNEPEPVVDGNVTRVLARLLWLKGDLKKPRAQKLLWQLARQLIDPHQPGIFNQALMELGSTVCTPTHPRCAECPVAHLCSAFQRGQPTAVPEPSAPKPTRQVVDVSVLIVHDGRVLLAQRPLDGLWGGLWEFPRATRLAHEPLEAIAIRAGEQVGLQVEPMEVVGIVKHAVTYSRIQLYGYLCAYRAGEPRSDFYSDLRWLIPDEFANYALSAPQKRLAEKFLERLLSPQKPLYSV